MSKPLPIIRKLYWPAMIPQAIMCLLVAAAAHFGLPNARPSDDLLIGAGGYLIFCRMTRRLLVGDHTAGIRAYRAGDFHGALLHFRASYEFFAAHRALDASRPWIFGVASRKSYRLIALLNMAYCYVEMGDGGKAINLFEQVLKEVPDDRNAQIGLRSQWAKIEQSAGDATKNPTESNLRPYASTNRP